MSVKTPPSTPTDPELEKRVDAMMEVKRGVGVTKPPEPTLTTQPIDIFSATGTASPLPAITTDKPAVNPDSQPKAETAKQPLPPASLPSSVVDSPETDKAVDDIITNDSDVLLAMQDTLTAHEIAAVESSPASQSSAKLMLLVIIVLASVAAAAVYVHWYAKLL